MAKASTMKPYNAFDKAIEIDPKLAEAWNNKGEALSSQGNYGEAIKAYDRAINGFNEVVKMNPKLAEFWTNLAQAWNNKGWILAKRASTMRQ